MTPAEVTAYLDALRRGGCMSAELVLPNLTLRAVFNPSHGSPLDAPETETPEGWPDWRGES